MLKLLNRNKYIKNNIKRLLSVYIRMPYYPTVEEDEYYIELEKNYQIDRDYNDSINDEVLCYNQYFDDDDDEDEYDFHAFWEYNLHLLAKEFF